MYHFHNSTGSIYNDNHNNDYDDGGKWDDNASFDYNGADDNAADDDNDGEYDTIDDEG